MIIDSHVHFVDLKRPEGVVWPEVNSASYCNFMPTEFSKETRAAGVSACVLIETSQRPVDNEWMLKLYEKETSVLGVVANLNPHSDDFSSQLLRLLPRSGFVGLRFRPIEQISLECEVLVSRVAELGHHEKTLELGANTNERLLQYAQLAAMAAKTTCILDHFGHPSIEPNAINPEWLQAIKVFAGNENACCKISGLLAFASQQPSPNSYAYFRPTLEALYQAFGPDRLLYGSNWPPARVAGSYQQALDILTEFFSGKGTQASENFFAGNATRMYGLQR